MLSKKVIITGSFGVGKTSLFNRFLFNTFSEKYLTTIGVKVDKKTVQVGDQEVSLILWDISGEVTQDKVPKSYFLGSSAVIYVFDLTRPLTLQNMEQDLALIEQMLPGCLVLVVGNKKDLIGENGWAQWWPSNDRITLTSAKTGERVEEVFMTIARKLTEDQ